MADSERQDAETAPTPLAIEVSEELVAEIEPVRRRILLWFLMLGGAVGLAALLAVLYFGLPDHSGGGWALGGSEVEDRFLDYLEASRFARAHEGLELVAEDEGDSVRVQRMTLALARTYLEEKKPRKAYELVSKLPLVDKSDEVMVEILEVKFDALRPYFFTGEGDLRAPYELPCYDSEANFTFRLDQPPRESWTRDKKELARRFLEDLEDAEALMEDRPRVRRAFEDLTRLKGLIRWAWDLQEEAVLRESIGDPAALPLPVRYQFANLLFRERRFEEAFSLFRPILERERDTVEARRAFGHVIRFYEIRKALSDSICFWDYRLGNLVEACLKHPGYAAIREDALFVVKGVLALRDRSRGKYEDVCHEKSAEIETDEPPIEDPVLKDVDVPFQIETFRHNLGREEPGRIFLQIDHREFLLTNPAKRPFYSATGGELDLYSLYHGTVRLHLHRFPDSAAYCAFDESKPVEGLRRSERVRTWTVDTGSIAENGSDALSVTVPVKNVEPGYYAVLAEARYCPVFSGVTLIVSDAMLAVRAGRTSLLAYVTDRMNGSPKAGVMLEAELSGRYDLERIAKDLLETDPDRDFRKGLTEGFAFASRKEAPDPAKREELRRAGPEFRRGWEKGVALRARYPASSGPIEAVTDEQGLAVFPVPEAMHRFAYGAEVRSVTPGMCFWSDVKSRADFHEQRLKTLFYTDRPLYRPGDEVHFKGIVRLFDGENYFLPDETPLHVEIAGKGTRVFAASLKPNDTGCVHGSFTLSTDVPLTKYSLSVQGEEKRALFEVRHYQKPDTEVSLDAERSILTAGETLNARVRVTTMAGEPRPGVKVGVTVRRIPMALEHRVGFRLPGESRSPDALERSGKTVFARDFLADPTGRIRFDFPTDPEIEAVYRIVATVCTPQCRITSSALVEARAVPVRLTVLTDRRMYRHGDSMELQVTTRDLRGRPVAWNLQLRETPRPRVKKRARDGQASPFVPEKRAFSTDGNGTARITLPVREGCGGFVLGVRFKGVWHDRDVPVEVLVPESPEGKSALRTDRVVYRPGDSMAVSVSVPASAKAVLVTGETDRILFSKVLAVEKGRASAEIPVRAAYGPNFFLASTAVFDDDVKTRTSETVRVIPVEKFLRLEIETDKSEYRPGEICRALVRVKDFDGSARPGASVSVGVVDVALYKIKEDRTPDLWSYFYSHSVAHRVNGAWFNADFEFPDFRIWKVPVLAWGKYWNSAIGIGGGAGGCFGGRFGGRRNLRSYGGGMTSSSPVRRRFRDLAFWRADLRSDAEGIIRFSFRVPDNITRFRFTARGVTPDTRVGEVRDRILVRKNFYASLRAPDLLRQGDRAEVRVLVRNRWNFEIPARLRFHAPFPVVGSDPLEAEFRAAPGEERVFRFTLDLTKLPDNARVPDSELAEIEPLNLRWDELPAVCRVELVALDRSGGEDRIVRALPFARSGAVIRGGRSGILDEIADRRELTLSLPKDGECTRVTVHLSGSISGAVLDGLDELIEYPYGCVEQTLSRFFPAALACGVKKLTGRDSKVKRHLEEAVRRGITNLGRLRLDNGAWGWYGRNDRSTGFMTSWALIGLAVGRRAGFEIPDDWFAKAVPHVAGLLESPAGRPPRVGRAFGRMNLRIIAALALSFASAEADVETPHLARYLFDGEAEEYLSDLDTACLAFVYAREGMSDRARALLSEILSRRSPAEIRNVKTLAFLLLAKEHTGSPSRSLRPLARFLLKQRTGRAWRSTTDSALATYALARYLVRFGAKEGESGAVVTVDGEEIGRIEGGRQRASFSVDPETLKGKKEVKLLLRRIGGGPVIWSAAVQSLSKEAMAEPRSRGIAIRPTLYVPERADAFRKVDPGAQAVVGDRVRVRLDIETKEEQEYVILVQPLPSAFRPSPSPIPGANKRNTRMNLVRHETVPGRLDLRRYEEDLGACEDAGLAGRSKEAWNRLLSSVDRALKGDHWSLVRKEEALSVHRIRISRTEARREAFLVFIEYLPPGTHAVLFDMVASSPARVILPPAWAAPMYRPEVFGRGTCVTIAAGKADASKEGDPPPTATPWEDREWAEAMFAHLKTHGDPGRVVSVARALRNGEDLAGILVREILRLETAEARDLVLRGFLFRPPSGDALLDGSRLTEEVRRRRRILEALRAPETPDAARAGILEGFLRDDSLYSLLERAARGGSSSLRPSEVLEALRRERELRLLAASGLPLESTLRLHSPLSFRKAASILHAGRDVSFLRWVLEDEDLIPWVDGGTYGEALSFIREELEIPVALDPLVPKGLLELSLRMGDDSVPSSSGYAALSSYLQRICHGIELSIEITPDGGGLRLAPLGARIGLSEETIRSRLEALCKAEKE